MDGGDGVPPGDPYFQSRTGRGMRARANRRPDLHALHLHTPPTAPRHPGQRTPAAGRKQSCGGGPATTEDPGDQRSWPALLLVRVNTRTNCGAEGRRVARTNATRQGSKRVCPPSHSGSEADTVSLARTPRAADPGRSWSLLRRERGTRCALPWIRPGACKPKFV